MLIEKKLLECTMEFKFIDKLANNLSKNRIDSYNTWRDFVFLCGNYGWHYLAHKISKKSVKYKIGPHN